MSQYSPEAYERVRELCQKNKVFEGVRIHTETIQKKVAKLLGVSYFLPSDMVKDLILEHRKQRWIDAFYIYPTDHLRQEIGKAILRTHLRQGLLWENIRAVLTTHNTRFPKLKLPLDKHNIALSILGKREMKLEEFVKELSINPPIEVTSGVDQAYSLRAIWRGNLDEVFAYKNKEVTLRTALIKIKKSSSIVTWQKQVLKIAQLFEQQKNINLGASSWVTLSRSVIGRDHDYMSQSDFLNFIEKAASIVNPTL